jgi:putative Holliday junction resolvase
LLSTEAERGVPEYESPAALKAALEAADGKGARLMGFDLGEKTIGLALSDASLLVASPLETIKRRRFTVDAERIAALCAEHGVGGLVIGLPVNMDGSEGPRAQSTRAFARNLDGKLGLPYAFWDERLSTAAVERMLVDEADMTRRRRGEVVDKLAASYILQGLLDALSRE